MKRLRIIIAVWLLLLMAPGIGAQEVQQKNVPSVIINALQLKFPKAGDVVWELENGLYKAEFEIDKKEYEVWLDYSGKLKRWKQDFDKNYLPQPVKLSIARQFDGFVPSSVEKLEEGRQVFYKMRLTKAADRRKVIFSDQGKLLSHQEL